MCGEVYGSWLEKARSLELPDTPNTHERGPQELQWVMFVLKALRLWLRYDSSFRSILSETVETFLRRGVNPNWVYGKHSLWTYFTACLDTDWSSGKYYSAESQKYALRVVNEFYRRGASPSQIIIHEAIHGIPKGADDIQSILDINSIQFKGNRDSPWILDAHAATMTMISYQTMI